MKRLFKRIWLFFAKALRAWKKWWIMDVDPDVDLDNLPATFPTPIEEKSYPIDVIVVNKEEIDVDVNLEILEKESGGSVNTNVSFHVAPNESELKEVFVSDSAYLLDFRKSVFITDTGETFYMHKRCVPARNISVTVTAKSDSTLSIRKKKAIC